MRQLALRRGVAFALVHCVAPDAVLRARVVARAQADTDPSDATPDVLALQQRVQQGVPADWAPWTHVVPNAGPLEALEQQVQALAAVWRRP
jgi:predicted kinase